MPPHRGKDLTPTTSPEILLLDPTDYHNQLNRIDGQILALLHQRATLAQQVSKHPAKSGNTPHREKAYIKQFIVQNEGQFPVDALETIYTEIISACRFLEESRRIAFLGPVGSFGHAASLRYFGSSAEFIPISPQTAIFTEVESGRADYGVVAIENSTDGTVRDVLEMFQHTNLQICAEVFLPITHSLLSKSPVSEITKIYSHPQPVAQCREWLHQNMKTVQQVEVASTSEAARLAANEHGAAGIASELASEIYALPIVAASIMDDPKNTTRFLVIGNHSSERGTNNRTSLLFAVKDKVGALWEVLGVLKTHQINMSKIDSRPSRTKAWEYVFFVELEGHIEDQAVQTALTALQDLCAYTKILGSYPYGL